MVRRHKPVEAVFYPTSDISSKPTMLQGLNIDKHKISAKNTNMDTQNIERSNIKLVGGFNPTEKYWSNKIASFPQVGVNITKKINHLLVTHTMPKEN